MANHVIRDRVWDSGKLERCSDGAAAWYPWIYLVCNEHGVLEYHPRSIWMTVFRRRPSVSQQDVEKWLAEYEREGLLVRYHMDGELAFWTGFKGRKPSERRDNTYPDPLSFPEVVKRLQELGITEFDGRDVPAPKGATRGRKNRDAGAEEPRQNRASIEQDQELDLEQDQELDPCAAPAAPSWSSEAVSDWQQFLGDTRSMAGRICAALKGSVDAEGWSCVRPLWREALEDAVTWPDPGRFTPEQFSRTFVARLARSRAGPKALMRVGVAAPTPKEQRSQAAKIAGVIGGLKGDGTFGGSA